MKKPQHDNLGLSWLLTTSTEESDLGTLGEVDRVHYDPLSETPEIISSRSTQTSNTHKSYPENSKHFRRSTKRRYQYGVRTRHRDGQVSYHEYQHPRPLTMVQD